MRVSYKIQDRFDFGLFAPMLFLLIIGLFAVYSSTINHPVAGDNFYKHLIWIIISLFIYFFIFILPKNTIRISAVWIYFSSFFFLLLVLVIGDVVFGAKSWIRFGDFGFQPAEYAKVGLILILAYWMSKEKEKLSDALTIVCSLAIGFIPVILILAQPDMGTAIVFIIITITMLFWNGLDLFTMFLILSPGVVAIASLFGWVALLVTLLLVAAGLIFFRKNIFISVTIFIFNAIAGFAFEYFVRFLKPHQQLRLASFIDPYVDPTGAGYNIIQAKVAIGSGGLWGKGFMNGNQTQLRFIPQQWTDFIYSVVGEEFGFIGCMFVLILFFIILWRLLKLATNAKDRFNSLVVLGVFMFIFTHFVINIGMNLGITPVIGLPLPFLSYGGSSLLAVIVLMGIVQNIYKNRLEQV
ncbi:MAG: rod shape-determining protein RodA [Ignavibacteriales bacterium]|nr:rod shape-determining protein RodA [Ignavibacteriales bacterium]